MITVKQAELMRGIMRCTGKSPSNKLMRFLDAAKITTVVKAFKLTEEKAKTIPGFDKGIMKELRHLNELSISATPKVNSGSSQFGRTSKTKEVRPTGIDNSEL